MLKPTRERGAGPPSSTRSDAEQRAWQESLDRRVTRIETVLTKLAVFLGMDPRTGKPLKKD